MNNTNKPFGQHKRELKNQTLYDIAISREEKYSESSKEICRAVLIHWSSCFGNHLVVGEINEDIICFFAEYLVSKVQISSARSYLQKLHAILNECVRHQLLSHNPMPPIARLLPYSPAARRTFLTDDEIISLQNTASQSPIVKSAFLFACFVGLRLSDIESLNWDNIKRQKDYWVIVKVQKKTRREIYIPVSKEAKNILRQMGVQEKGRIFQLPSRTTIAMVLKQWALSAGIHKPITFHVSRHTFATLLLSANVEIYTVSALCGHSSVKTTEIYAHILDSSMQDAVNGVDRLLANKRKRLSVPQHRPVSHKGSNASIYHNSRSHRKVQGGGKG